MPKDRPEYAPHIQAFVDQDYNVIVTVGFNLGRHVTTPRPDNPERLVRRRRPVDRSASMPTARADCDVRLHGRRQDRRCRTTSRSTSRKTRPATSPGIVAASVSKSGTIGAIGGTTLCAPCVRYIQGYELGAKSVNPAVIVKTAYVTNDFSNNAFNDPVGGKKFAQQFITTNKLDVLFQVAGKTGNGVLEAACDANIYGIGVDVDQCAVATRTPPSAS